MKLENIYIDLSKLTIEEYFNILILVFPIFKKHKLNFLSEYFIDSKFIEYDTMWMATSSKEDIKHKTELTYPDFIKLFEGGDDYQGKRYQPLFDHLHSEHGLILHESEMEEIIRIVNNLNSNK